MESVDEGVEEARTGTFITERAPALITAATLDALSPERTACSPTLITSGDALALVAPTAMPRTTARADSSPARRAALVSTSISSALRTDREPAEDNSSALRPMGVVENLWATSGTSSEEEPDEVASASRTKADGNMARASYEPWGPPGTAPVCLSLQRAGGRPRRLTPPVPNPGGPGAWSPGAAAAAA
ncbi:hypothetical protein MFU01_63760 [Myxococcus fulvus]|uniref:Uncharacterized protein n=1 Tax=Myxococcus fulvus TaxID=33 RepID=A0A511TAX0_MYXFU|nr:hypothetical protein MFU01_63760 [Myxococcus fulvus]